MIRATGLKLHTNDKFKRVLKPSCTVKIDNNVTRFNDFVAVGYDPETGNTTIINNADTVTLGQALLMINNKFQESLQALSEQDRQLVLEMMGGQG